MQIVINNQIIYADGYTLIPEEKVVQFYREKSDLDYIPPIKVDVDILSDFGNKVLLIESEKMINKNDNVEELE